MGDNRRMMHAVRSISGTPTVVEVPEQQMNALSTISGSGPAYVFFLIERLTGLLVMLGLSLDRKSVV